MTDQSVYLDLERSVTAADTYTVHRWMTEVVDKPAQVLVYAIVYRCAELGGTFVGGSRLLSEATTIPLRTVQDVTRKLVESGALLELDSPERSRYVHGSTKCLAVNSERLPAPIVLSAAPALNDSEFNAGLAPNSAAVASNQFSAAPASNSAAPALNDSEFNAGLAPNSAAVASNQFSAAPASNSAAPASNSAAPASNPPIPIYKEYVVDRLDGLIDNQPTIQPTESKEEFETDSAAVGAYGRLTAMTENRNRIDATWEPFLGLLAEGLTGEEICTAWDARQRKARENGSEGRYMPQLRKWLMGDPVTGSARLDVAALRNAAEKAAHGGFRLFRTPVNWIVATGGSSEIVTDGHGVAVSPDTPREQVESIVEGRLAR